MTSTAYFNFIIQSNAFVWFWNTFKMQFFGTKFNILASLKHGAFLFMLVHYFKFYSKTYFHRFLFRSVRLETFHFNKKHICINIAIKMYKKSANRFSILGTQIFFSIWIHPFSIMQVFTPPRIYLLLILSIVRRCHMKRASLPLVRSLLELHWGKGVETHIIAFCITYAGYVLHFQ